MLKRFVGIVGKIRAVRKTKEYTVNQPHFDSKTEKFTYTAYRDELVTKYRWVEKPVTKQKQEWVPDDGLSSPYVDTDIPGISLDELRNRLEELQRRIDRWIGDPRHPFWRPREMPGKNSMTGTTDGSC